MAFDWNTTIVWHNAASDQNWFDAANWVHNGGEPCGVIPPDGNTFVVIEPYPGPIIDGAATCSALAVGDWSWAGAPDSAVEVNSGTLNAGELIYLAANGTDFLYVLLDANGLPLSAPGAFGLTVNGGTVTTPGGPTGIIIGGGSLGYTYGNIGRITMYGGLISVPAVSLRNGTISLYGGTLECTGDSNFVFYQSFPNNKIDVSGGTLKLTGDYNLIAPTFPNLIAGGVIYSSRGTVGIPTYDSGSNITTLSCVPGSVNMFIPWGPSPANNALNVHYHVNDANVGVTLSWNSGSEPNVINHDVYFGTDYNGVTLATEANTQFVTEVNEANEVNGVQVEPNSWLISSNNYNFKINTNYYWRVDDNWISSNIYDSCGVVIGSNTTLTKGPTWTFRTHDGKAYNPKPYNGRVGLAEPLALSWTKGDFVGTANSHRVYIGTDSGSVFTATGTNTGTKIFRTVTTATSYSFTNLATNWYGPLVSGNTYYWKIAEANSAVLWGGGLSDGIVWTFTPTAVITVEDFEDYNNTGDVNTNWSTGYTTCTAQVEGGVNPRGILTYVIDSAGKHGNFLYNNYIAGGGTSFSEERRSYSNVIGGTIFTGNTSVLSVQPAALRVDYIGAATNGVNPTYDRMYVAIEDTAGNVGVVPNPDASASQAANWTQWYIALNDSNFTPVSLAQVQNFYVGFGQRCVESQSAGRDGNVMFDNIRLYSQTCNPAVTLSADMDGDCDVDINDLTVFAEYWLQKADLRTFDSNTVPHKAPILWYKFNDSGNTSTVKNYGTGDTNGTAYAGTVNRWAALNWNATGGRSGGPCLFIPPISPFPTNNQSYVDAPPKAVGFMDDANHSGDGGGISFTMWANASMIGDFLAQWPGIFGVWNTANTAETVEVPCPSRLTPGANTGQVGFYEHTPGTGTINTYLPLLDFGGRWNHWAFIKTNNNAYGSGSLSIYCNGIKVASQDANGQDGDPNVGANGPLFATPAGAIHIGTRGTNWAMWSGKLADFQIYDYALSDTEVEYLATDGTGKLLLPLTTKANLYINEGEASPSASDANQIVDFKDLAVMGSQWHSQQLWP
jgi:hypothetical protein